MSSWWPMTHLLTYRGTILNLYPSVIKLLLRFSSLYIIQPLFLQATRFGIYFRNNLKSSTVKITLLSKAKRTHLSGSPQINPGATSATKNNTVLSCTFSGWLTRHPPSAQSSMDPNLQERASNALSSAQMSQKPTHRRILATQNFAHLTCSRKGFGIAIHS